MEVFELILEAVENSVEAGASHIDVTVDGEDGRNRVSITDDGCAALPDAPFDAGCTTKGAGRGQGLSKICNESGGCCSISRLEGRTRLEFLAGEDKRVGDLSSSLLPIFLFPVDISLTINIAGKGFTLSTWQLREHDAFPDRAGAIGRFRELVQLKEGEIYG